MKLDGMEAAMYLRKSRADEEGQSTEEVLARHQATLTEYAKRQNIHVVETYPEVASGESLYARPQMLRLLENVEAGEYGCVLCMDMDRLSRGSMRDQGIVLDAFKDSGTLIVTPDKVYDLSMDIDEQYAELKSFISRQEYKAIVKRLHRGRLRSVQEGCYLVSAPYGYRNIVVDKKPTLEIKESEAQYVRLIFEWYASGIGCVTISYRLNEMGVRSATGIDFRPVSILRMLKNPVYIGKIIWGQTKVVKKKDQRTCVPCAKEEWKLYDGLHPAIVDKALWDKVQEIMSKRYIPAKRDGMRKSQLAGIVRCEKCGRLMNRLPYPGKPPYLACLKKGCSSMTKLEFVEQSIIDQLEDAFAELTIESISSVESGHDVEIHKKRLEAIRKELASVDKKKVRLYEFLEDGTYSKEEFRTRMEAIKGRVAALEQQQREAQSALDAAENRNPDKLAETLRAVLDGYWSSDVAERNALLKSVIEVVWYAKEKRTKPTDFTLRVVLKTL